MTQEQKNLLMRDLCARLPYRVKFKFKYSELSSEIMRAIFLENYVIISSKDNSCEINDIKPYLFPLSSMTEEQRAEYESLCIKETSEYSDLYGIIFAKDHYYDTVESIDYLYKNHIDVRGLIPLGLAIDCTNLNIY